MAIKAIAAVVGAVAASVGTAGSIVNQNKAVKAQNRALRLEREINDFQAARERREAIRQARIAYAQQTVAAEAGGTSSTSAAQGALTSTGSQTRGNVSFLDVYNRYMGMIGVERGNANVAGAKAGNSAAIAGLGLNLVSIAPTLGGK